MMSIKGEVGVAEAIAAITLISVISAALFNLGFFSKMHWSYVSLLSPQDIALGTFAASPMVGLALPIWYYIGKKPEEENRWSRTAQITLSSVGFLVALFVGDWVTKQLLAPFLGVTALVVVVGALYALVATWTKIPLKLAGMIAALAVLLLPTIAGRAAFSSWATPGLDPVHTLVMNSGEVREIHLIRATSQYVFYLYQENLVFGKLTDVRELRQSSIEATPWVR